MISSQIKKEKLKENVRENNLKKLRMKTRKIPNLPKR